MRWLFLLLLVLNAFYYVWHQQQVPMQAVALDSVEQYQLHQTDIRLLSEAPTAVARTMPVPLSTAELSMCLFLGGFESREKSAALRQRLASLDIDSTERAVATEAGADYWVYLPPLASRGASLRQLKELQARQIDSFIIAEGDLANGISLGIFPHYESAASVLARLTEAGYQPELREISRDQRSYWVRVGAEQMRLIDGAFLESLAIDFHDLRHEVRSCEPALAGQKVE